METGKMVLAGVITLCIWFPVLHRKLASGAVFTRGAEQVKRAKDAGRTVKGNLILNSQKCYRYFDFKSRPHARESDNPNVLYSYSADYAYWLDDSMGICTVRRDDYPFTMEKDSEITLLYDEKGRAFPESRNERGMQGWLLALGPLITFIVLAKIMN